MIWESIRAAIGATVFLGIAAVLGGVPSAWGILAIGAASLTAAAFAAPMAAFSIRQDTDLAFPRHTRQSLAMYPLSAGGARATARPGTVPW